jgi:hypothetical protein
MFNSSATDSLFLSWAWVASSPTYPATGFNVAYGMSGYNPYTQGTEVVFDNNLNDTITNPALLGGGVYQVYVQAVCANDTSAYIGPFNVVMPLTNDDVCGAELLATDGTVYTFNNIWDVGDAGLVALKAAADIKARREKARIFHDRQLALIRTKRTTDGTAAVAARIQAVASAESDCETTAEIFQLILKNESDLSAHWKSCGSLSFESFSTLPAPFTALSQAMKAGTKIYPDVNKIDLNSFLAMAQVQPQKSYDMFRLETEMRGLRKDLSKQTTPRISTQRLFDQINSSDRISSIKRGLMN